MDLSGPGFLMMPEPAGRPMARWARGRAVLRKGGTAVEQLVLGRHIAEHRRSQGWTQAELAGMLGRPVAWVSQLEQGLVQVGPAAAGPLPAPVICSRPGDDACPDQARVLRQVLSRCGQDSTARSLRGFPPAFLAVTAAEVWDLAEAGRYGELAALLGDLIPDLEAAARTAQGPEQAGLDALAATCYKACSAALARLGDHDSALVAADRALTAAHRAGDLLATAASGYLLACVLMESRRHDQARVIRVGGRGIDERACGLRQHRRSHPSRRA